MSTNEKALYDVEYHADEKHRSSIVPDDSGAVHGELFVTGDTKYAKLQRFVTRFGVEARGIERVPEDERTDKRAGNPIISAWLGGLRLDDFLHQLSGCTASVLFLDVWSEIWHAPDDSVALLLWLLRSEAQ